jgi:hypothetical protein
MFAINRITGKQIISERCTGTTRGSCPVSVEFDRDGKAYVDTNTSDFEDDYSYDLDVECDGYYVDAEGDECTEQDIVFVATLPPNVGVTDETDDEQDEDEEREEADSIADGSSGD